MTLAELLRKYLDDELSPDELRLFREVATHNENRAELDRLLAQWMGNEFRHGSAEGIDVDAWYEELTRRHGIPVGEAPSAAGQVKGGLSDPGTSGTRNLSRGRLLLFAAAAAACVLAVAGIFLFRGTTPISVVVKPKTPPQVIIPVGNRAVLTLADGSRVTLDTAANGLLAKQGNALVVKLAGGQLAYKTPKPGTDDRPLFNEIATPRGGFYELVLPDGSKVWLDAASSLRFPTAFTGASRSVELTGEAYFEVAPRPQQPFLITTQGVTVQVLGTELNLMAYADEDAIRTTLVNGAVRVVRGGARQELRPGEQAAWLRDSRRWQVSTPDMKQVLAWKRMEFRFEGLPIDAIMRQIGRWYDVDIVFRGPQPVGEFNGVISRKQSVADLLTVLEQTDIVHFTIEGRKVIVERKL